MPVTEPLQIDRVNRRRYAPAVKSEDVRREYLRQGGRLGETARALDTSRQNVEQHVQRANKARPLPSPAVNLTFPPDADPEDAQAIATYIRSQLDRVGVPRPADPHTD